MTIIRPSIFLSVFFLSATFVFAESDPIDILSINVRLSLGNDGENDWKHRKEMLLGVVREGRYDFIGAQEVVLNADPEKDQFGFLQSRLPEYGCIGRSREATPDKGEATPVYYRKDRWELDPKEQGTFWLSDTPEAPGSITWEGQSQCPRVVSGGLFHEIDDAGKRTGLKLYVYSTHLDHVGETARIKSAELIQDRLIRGDGKEIPAVLMGDFNAGESSKTIRIIKGEEGDGAANRIKWIDSFRAARPREKNAATYHGFRETDNTDLGKIDYIFITSGLKTMDARIIRFNVGGRFPSDHHPVRATLRFP